ncbi:hypothetical protein JM18_006274 [Phytophthora kernoviae]|uniref:Uncharacterized protein n=2 Tax=Phytophthora kernoviae TaxID=325452 RepID=A0A921SF14_9STRA|nr:hypothetical protein G195_007766 [Phytophthora kernoviae 00238/432]KAG2522193.1 hypothetical protein JM18_006274 [Phytophthora kernoviae]
MMLKESEIEVLTGELEQLQKQMEYYADRTKLLKQREALRQRELANRSLHEILQTQRLSIANSVSMCSQFLRDKDTGPFGLPVKLSRDPVERQVALLRMKQECMEISQQFILQRQHFLDAAEFCDRKKFEATNGDQVSMRFEVVPLPEARSIKAIVDALQTYVYNIEINVSAAAGDVTVRENDDPKPGCAVAQNRLVTTLANIVQVDTNNIAFSGYCPAGPPGTNEKEVGILICESVDEDELYPYHPLERVRQDLSVIIIVAWNQREDGEPIIVVTRWSCVRVRKSHLTIPPFVMNRILSGVDKTNAAILSTARSASCLSV